jgi:hypothetical protein
MGVTHDVTVVFVYPPTVVEHFDKGYAGQEYVTTSVVVVDYDEGGEPSKMTIKKLTIHLTLK